MLKGSSTNDKIIRILKRMDEILLKNNFCQYQERIHRIYKTLVSIERHDGCFVSNFNPDGSNEEEFSLNYIKDQDDQIVSSLNVNDEENIEKEAGEQREHGLELGDIFDFIEDELNLKSLISIEDSTMYSSSDDENLDNEPIEEKKPFKRPNRENMQKNFFNIELRLRAYLKEQELFRNYSLDSILNDSKLRTPVSKIDTNKRELPAIMKNFFEDKAIIEAAKKRYSVREGLRGQIEKLGNPEELFKCRSYCDKMKISSNVQSESSNISSFSIDTQVSSQNTERNSITLLKRGSIFRDKFNMNDFSTVKEEVNSDSGSYESDEENSDRESSGSYGSVDCEIVSNESDDQSDDHEKKLN
jgi:hypothetical protein